MHYTILHLLAKLHLDCTINFINDFSLQLLLCILIFYNNFFVTMSVEAELFSNSIKLIVFAAGKCMEVIHVHKLVLLQLQENDCQNNQLQRR